MADDDGPSYLAEAPPKGAGGAGGAGPPERGRPKGDARTGPPKRAGQLWVAWSMESKANYQRLRDPAFMRQFDLTMTYRLDADVPVTYLPTTIEGEGVEQIFRRPPGPKSPDRLATMFTAAGLIEVSASIEDEIACLGDAGFENALAIWQRAILTMASPMIETGTIDAAGADAAAAAWADWRHVARRQHMVMRGVVGRRPAGGHR